MHSNLHKAEKEQGRGAPKNAGYASTGSHCCKENLQGGKGAQLSTAFGEVHEHPEVHDHQLMRRTCINMVASPSPGDEYFANQLGNAVANNTTNAVMQVILPPWKPKTPAKYTPTLQIAAASASAINPSRTGTWPRISPASPEGLMSLPAIQWKCSMRPLF